MKFWSIRAEPAKISKKAYFPAFYCGVLVFLSLRHGRARGLILSAERRRREMIISATWNPPHTGALNFIKYQVAAAGCQTAKSCKYAKTQLNQQAHATTLIENVNNSRQTKSESTSTQTEPQAK
jgi:hypothetical protein